MNKPLALSLIIPAYNEEKHLAACLDSVDVQTIMPTEVIVVNNNSTDDTVKLAKTYPFVRVINEKEQGIVYARNAGFNAAKGDIIGRIDADSILPPDWVAHIKDFYADPAHANAAFTGGGYYYNTPTPRISRYILDLLAFRVNRVALGHHFLFGSNMALPKTMWSEIRGKVCTRTDIHEDIDIAIHTHDAGFKIVYEPRFLVGVKLRRVFQDHDKLWATLMLWPRSLKTHQKRLWMTGWFGAVLLYVLTPLLYPLKALQLLHIRAAGFIRKRS